MLPLHHVSVDLFIGLCRGGLANGWAVQSAACTGRVKGKTGKWSVHSVQWDGKLDTH